MEVHILWPFWLPKTFKIHPKGYLGLQNGHVLTNTTWDSPLSPPGTRALVTWEFLGLISSWTYILPSLHGNTVRINGYLCEKPLMISGFPAQRASDAELWYFLWYNMNQPMDKTIKRQVNWDALAHIWRHYNANMKSSYFDGNCLLTTSDVTRDGNLVNKATNALSIMSCIRDLENFKRIKLCSDEGNKALEF